MCIHVRGSIYVCIYVCVCVFGHISIYVYTLSGILPPRTWPCGGWGRAQERGVGVSEIIFHGSMYIRSMTLSVSRNVALSLSQAFVHPRTHPLINHSPTHSFYFSLSYFISLSLSLVCMCVRACVSLSPSFSRFRPCILSQDFCLSPSFSCTHILAHTQSHALSHPLTHKRKHAPNLCPHLSCSLTHISLSSSLFLSLSLFLSRSLLHTYTDTHTHSHSHTLSLIHSLIHSFIVVACARCVVFSARTRARSLLSVSLPVPPFVVLFFCNSVSFALFLPSRTTFACFLAVFLSLVRFLSFSTPGSHDFNLKQSCSHCECILSLSCPWRFLSDGTVEEKNRRKDKLMIDKMIRKDRDLLVPAAKFSYV